MAIKQTLNKLLGDQNKKAIKAVMPIVNRINELESTFEKLSDAEIQAKTQEFKDRLAKGETIDDLHAEAFATVREAAKRTMGMRHYDVQLIGGTMLHRGKIAEMRTGEGKTLVATLPTYLNALEGKGVHVVTVNDYLAKRDAVWMGQIYDFLGMSVGIIQNQRISYMYSSSEKEHEEKETDDMLEDLSEGNRIDKHRDEQGSFKVEEDYIRSCSRKEAYQADITYGTNNEFGFDYLRDNMVQELDQMVMREGSEMHYAIIDEVDSILIDEARTPLIISAPADEVTEQYNRFSKLVYSLKENEDYNVDEKLRSVTLSEEGITKCEGLLGIENIYAEGGLQTVHHLEQALKAHVLFKRDKDYVVEGSEVVIIDEFTGRKMPGRRYSEGLHQAIEAKENVQVQRESRTLSTITFQNLFRMYTKLSGMTGTGATEEEELNNIYGLEVIVVPTNRPDARKDHADRIYRNEKGKMNAIAEKIEECQKKGQPILVGTISVEKNEELSEFLTKKGIKHEVLNAKNHEREGEIVAQAGRIGAVTLATNMAGRGVDIKLGGSPVSEKEEQKVKDLGGLFVLGTERHESRRIDNQLRGRSARQGDPGETQFFVSADDDLMRIFAGDRLKNVMKRLNVPEDMPLEQNMITKMLENAQKKVESHHYDSRKHLLEYDDVLNRQRQAIYSRRREILEVAAGKRKDKALKDLVLEMIEQEIEFVVSFHTNNEDREDWNMQEIYETVRTMYSFPESKRDELVALAGNGDSKLGDVEAREAIVQRILDGAKAVYEEMEEKLLAKNEQTGETDRTMLEQIEKGALLRSIDALWVEHLVSIDYLRAGIGLRGYGQRDPLIEYKKETFRMFNELQANIQKEVVYSFFKITTSMQLAPSVMAAGNMMMAGAKKSEGNAGGRVVSNSGSDVPKVGRNEPCPCGSGKKFKKCHGV